MAAALAAFIHGGIAYWFYTEPKLQVAYHYPGTYEELRMMAAAGIVMIAFAIATAITLKKAWMALACVPYFAFFGLLLDPALVLQRGWMQAGIVAALLGALAAKLLQEYAQQQQTLAPRRLVIQEDDLL